VAVIGKQWELDGIGNLADDDEEGPVSDEEQICCLICMIENDL
jgi:hypothetical protein